VVKGKMRRVTAAAKSFWQSGSGAGRWGISPIFINFHG
jgi:hypothetical protein